MTDEELAMLDEQVLVAALQPRRPNADAFAAKVTQRLAARQLQQQQQENAPMARAAAAGLPVGALPTPDGFSVVKLLSLPLVTLAAAVLTFVAGLRSAKAPVAAPAPAWRASLLALALHIGPLLLLVTPWFFGASAATDLLMALLVAAMALFPMHLRRTSLAPAEVARLGTAILATTYVACFLWEGMFDAPAADSALGHGFAAMTLLAGMLGTSVLQRLLGDTSWRARIALALATGWLAVVLTTSDPLGASSTSADELADDVAAFHADPTKLGGWSEIAATVATLDAIGAPRPDLARIEASVARAVRDPALAVHPTVWSAAARMGVLDDAEWRALASRQAMAARIDDLSQLQQTAPLQWSEFQEYEVWMLRGARGVSSELAEHLVRRIEAAWPKPATFGELQGMALRAHLFEALGRADRIAAHRDEIHAALQRQWVAQARGLGMRSGGFSPDRLQFATSSEEATWAAVELMARVGVPDGIDLRRLRSYLRARSDTPWLGRGFPPKQLARATMARLEGQLGLPERAVWLRVLDERVLVGTVLLVALCLLSIRIAVRAEARRAGFAS